ncbi:MAG: efflux RND transporter permease subunit [Candidatus Sumerlaeia bacterium]
MLITNWSLKHTTAVYVFMVVLAVLGLASYSRLPLESFPEIKIPLITVVTTYEGVSPSDIETQVTIPIEKKLRGIADVDELYSASYEGASRISVQFTPDVDIEDALQKVRDKVNQAQSELPEDANDPQIFELNFAEFPILTISISGDAGLVKLREIAEDLEDKIESIPGVLDVEVIGGLEREIYVEFDQKRVAAYGLSLALVLQQITANNITVPSGSMNLGQGKFLLKVPAEFSTPAELNNIVIAQKDDRAIYLPDVARVVDGYKEQLTYSRVNGEENVTISVKKRVGANIIAVADQIKQLLEAEQKAFPRGVRSQITLDQSDRIRDMVTDLENNIITGLILVLIVVFAALGGRNALFVSLAIPFSMLMTFIALQMLGITLNMVVLFSLILALGMLVDNGIVIVENIYRHYHEEGKTRWGAARDAVAEVGWPVITSTATTVTAFLPLMFWPGIVGDFMKYLPITLICALSGSLFVALVINPVLCATSMRLKKKHRRERDLGENGRLNWFMRLYEKLLRLSLELYPLTLIGVGLLLVLMILLYVEFGQGLEFFPSTEPLRANVEVKMPQGTRLEVTDRYMREVERVASEYPDIKFFVTNTGLPGSSQDMASAGGGGAASHYGNTNIEFFKREQRRRSSTQIIEEIRRRLKQSLYGCEIKVEREHEGPPTGYPIKIEVSGDDFDRIAAAARIVRKTIADVPGVVDLKDDYAVGQPEIHVKVDKEKAALLKLTAQQIGEVLKTAVRGRDVGVYRESDEEYDIIARLPQNERYDLTLFDTLMIPNLEGKPIPLSSVGEADLTLGFSTIRRHNQKRIVSVTANVAEGMNANSVRTECMERLKKVSLPAGTWYDFTGEFEDQQESQAFLSQAFLIAMFLIALILITQFNSVLLPFIIMSSVVLSLIGVFLGLIITGEPFGIIMTGLGVISLGGVVVNNAIVLIDYIQQLRERGLDVKEALVRAGLVRFRPVMLTAVTTILGLVPMAVGVSFDFINWKWVIGAESVVWWRPMAVAVIFGLGFATLLTLVVVPTLYLFFDRAQRGLVGVWGRLWSPRSDKAKVPALD